MFFYPMGPAPRVVVLSYLVGFPPCGGFRYVFFGIATGFLEHFRAGVGGMGGGGSVPIPGIHVLRGCISYCESFVLQSQYVGCLVAGMIS